MLSKHCGWPAGVDRPHAALEDVSLPEPRLSPDVRARFVKTVGEDFVRDDHAVRVSHAAGRSLPDLIRLRSGRLTTAPDAVLYPASNAEVDALLAVCTEESVAVVPFGGGTSVVGGIDALRGEFSAVVSISMARLDRIVDIDEESLTATVQAGVFGPDLEEALQALEADHEFLLEGNVFTPELIETWIAYKREAEILPLAQRPHPYEFELYYGA